MIHEDQSEMISPKKNKNRKNYRMKTLQSIGVTLDQEKEKIKFATLLE